MKVKVDSPCLRYVGHGGLVFSIHGRPELVSRHILL